MRKKSPCFSAESNPKVFVLLLNFLPLFCFHFLPTKFLQEFLFVKDFLARRIAQSKILVLRRFKREMPKNFKMSDFGVLSYYLGIEVQQSTAGITICQGAYAKMLLDTAGLADSNPTRTPMEARLQLRKAGTTAKVDSTNYRNIVRSLRYLVNIRPDPAYSVGYVSRFMGAPREEHLVAVKCILCYVAGCGWNQRLRCEILRRERKGEA